MALLALGSLRGSQAAKKQLLLSPLYPNVTNGLNLPRTEGFLGQGTSSFKTGKVLGRLERVGHSTASFAVTFYQNGPPPSEGGSGWCPERGINLQHPWQEATRGFQREESRRPLLPLVYTDKPSPRPQPHRHCLSQFFWHLNYFHYIESVQMMVTLSYRKMVLPGL